MPEPLFIAKISEDFLTEIALLPKLKNLHGLIADATGTGESAFEKLLGRRGDAQSTAPSPGAGWLGAIFGKIGDVVGGYGRNNGGGREGTAESAMKSAARAMSSEGRPAHYWRRVGVNFGWTQVK